MSRPTQRELAASWAKALKEWFATESDGRSWDNVVVDWCDSVLSALPPAIRWTPFHARSLLSALAKERRGTPIEQVLFDDFYEEGLRFWIGTSPAISEQLARTTETLSRRILDLEAAAAADKETIEDLRKHLRVAEENAHHATEAHSRATWNLVDTHHELVALRKLMRERDPEARTVAQAAAALAGAEVRL